MLDVSGIRLGDSRAARHQNEALGAFINLNKPKTNTAVFFNPQFVDATVNWVEYKMKNSLTNFWQR